MRADRRLLSVVVLLSLCVSGSSASAARIEAVQGKRYVLTKQHGPWMIMVASLYAASPDGTVRDGKTPQQIAAELVHELRQRGIPAYTYSMEGVDGTVETTDRLGRAEKRKFLTTRGQVCVIAGNYKNLNDAVAQKSLKYIKKLHPDCLGQKGVKLFKKAQQGPLSGAFLTVNPLLSPEEIKERQRDPLLVKLNSGGKYSLYQNKGAYSMVVATFTGRSKAHFGDSNSPEAQQDFQINVKDNDLDAASTSAWELAVSLRERDNIDAYVWHDRYQSVVAVGAFSSPDDPSIKRYYRVFAASTIAQVSNNGDPVMYPEAPSKNFGLAAGGTGIKVYAIGGFGKNGNENRLWAFDSTPIMIKVPKRR